LEGGEMNERMRKLRDAGAEEHSELKYKMMNGLGVQVKTAMDDYKSGFNVAHDLLMKDVEGLVKAIEQYAFGDLTPVATNALAEWNSKYGDEA
jgi:hypothetical protein